MPRLQAYDRSETETRQRLAAGRDKLRDIREAHFADGRNTHAVCYDQRTHSLNNELFAFLIAKATDLDERTLKIFEECDARLDRLERALALTVDLNGQAAKRLNDLTIARALADDARVAAASGSTLHRAYAMIEGKAVQGGKRRSFRGIASTGEVDRAGDRIDPLGAIWAKEGIPLLHAHDHLRPIGIAKLGPASKFGIEFKAEIATITEPGPLKDRCDTAWGEVAAALTSAVSIGFRPLDGAVEILRGGGTLFKAIEIIELSICTIPCNASARITEVEHAA